MRKTLATFSPRHWLNVLTMARAATGILHKNLC
nr:MAG TPA: hypothetical protein [Caudoviricetes sp.]